MEIMMDDKSYQDLQSNDDIVAELKKASLLNNEREKLRGYIRGFEELGDWYVRESDLVTGDILIKHRMKLKAVCLYNLALASGGDQQVLVKKIQMIEEGFLTSSGSKKPSRSTHEYIEEIKEYKQDLFAIGKIAGQKLAQINIASIEVKKIYKKIADGLNMLFAKMLDKCFEVMPLLKDCQYSIVVLGSLAREEATPYSDLEWAILIDEDNDSYKKYFHRLTELVWIKILNLQSTTPRMMDIKELDWFFESESPCKKGLSFDGQMPSGCHTPLGNLHHAVPVDQRYELIGTPDQLSDFQLPKWENKRGFCTVLSTAVCVKKNDHGILLKKYQEKIRLKTKDFSLNRALKFLSDSLARFKFDGGRFDVETHFFDAKYHLYRLPTMWIEHLSSYFSVDSINIWDRITDIFIKKISNVDGGNNINRTVSQILAIRLQTYIDKGYRDDHVIMIDPDDHEKNETILEKYFGVKIEVIFRLITVLIQLHATLLDCLEQPNKMEEILLRTVYPENNKFAVGYIYCKLSNYRKAIEKYNACIETASEMEKTSTIFPLIHYELGLTYFNVCDYENALKMLSLALSLYLKLKTSKEIKITCVDIIFTIGKIYHFQLKPMEAMNKLLETVTFYNLIFGPESVEVTKHWGRVGKAFLSFNSYDAARILLEKTILKLESSLADDSIFLAEMNVALGRAYCFLSRYNDSIAAYERAIEFYSEKLGANCIDIGQIKMALGEFYLQQREYSNAIKVLTESKKIFADNAGGYCWRVTSPLGMLAAIYVIQSNYSMAIRQLREMKNIYRSRVGRHAYYEEFRLKMLIDIYTLQCEYKKAKNKCKKAQLMVKNISISVNILHFSAAIENKLGLIYIELRKFEKARNCAKKAIDIYYIIEDIDPNNASKILYNSNKNFILSHLREGNLYLLQAEMNFESAIACYENAKLSQLPQDPDTHVFFQSWYWQNDNVRAVVEHCLILTRTQAYKVLAFHKIGRMLHIQAQIKLDMGNYKDYIILLEQAKCSFKKGMELDNQASICVDYALFLWHNRKYFNDRREAINLTKRAIRLSRKDSGLSYSRLDRPIVDINLQLLIDRHQKISFNACFLAHYLLIKIYVEINQQELAITQLSLFGDVLKSNSEPEQSLAWSLLNFSRNMIDSHKLKGPFGRLLHRSGPLANKAASYESLEPPQKRSNCNP